MAAVAATGRAQFKRILREIHLQYSHPKDITVGKGLLGINIHANKIWTTELKDAFRANANVTDPVKIQELERDGEDLAIYLESQRAHKDLVERYNPMYWDEEKGLQVEKTAQMVGFEMPSNYDESQRNEALKPAPRFTYKDPAQEVTADTKYVELEKPEEPAKRTYQIPKAFGFADDAKDDLGRPGDRKM